MRRSRRLLAFGLIALGLLSSVEGGLLAHGHFASGETVSASQPASEAPTQTSRGCAACSARAAVDSVVIDTHPERHGAAPFARILLPPRHAPPTRGLAPAPARAPPHRIV